jgi:hypothetical protein
MPENWLPYREILRVNKMPKVACEPHGIRVLYHSFRTPVEWLRIVMEHYVVRYLLKCPYLACDIRLPVVTEGSACARALRVVSKICILK